MQPSHVVPPARFGAQARLRALQSDIMELILDRELEPGDALPTENELCLALGVGRNTLRESLKVLQALGVIEIRHGFGMFVATSNFESLADGLIFRGRLSLRHHGREARQLVDVRHALEAGLIGSAMDEMTAEQLAAIEESVVRMEESAEAGEAFVEADAEFHRRLFEPLSNELLLNLLGVFWKVYRKIYAEVGPGVEDLPGLAAVHRNIYSAVAAGDKARAARELTHHFEGFRQRIREAVAE